MVSARRRQGDEQWKQRFEEFGLSDQFELIARDWNSCRGTKASVKCKTCGCFFDTWNVKKIFDGKVSGLTCPDCGMRSNGVVQWTKSHIRDEAFAYYLEGHTINEVAEKYHISVVQFEYCRRYLGVTKSQEQRKDSWRKSLAKASAKGNKIQMEHAKQKRLQHLSELGFDYVFDVGEGTSRQGGVRCRKCGHVFEKSISHLTNGNVVCPECVRLEREEKERIRREEIEDRKKQKEVERFQKNPLGLSYYQLDREKRLDVVHVCFECGKEYTIRMRLEKEGMRYCRDSGYCSHYCQKRAARKRRRIIEREYRNHKGRAKRYGCEYDTTVTLKALIKRDGLRCGICGRMCNPFDNTWNEYFGASSPTLDHIIPLAKGGSHTWDNVQVAHAICNSRKKDDMKEVRADDAS